MAKSEIILYNITPELLLSQISLISTDPLQSLLQYELKSALPLLNYTNLMFNSLFDVIADKFDIPIYLALSELIIPIQLSREYYLDTLYRLDRYLTHHNLEFNPLVPQAILQLKLLLISYLLTTSLAF